MIEIDDSIAGMNEPRSKGLIPRDFAAQPQGFMASAPAFNLPLIPRSEWQGRLDAQKANNASLKDIRAAGVNGQRIPSRDQNGKGYCWGHSGTSAAILVRARDNQAYADLSAFAVCCIIKGYRNEGGNGIDSVEFIAKRGIPTASFWPQQSMSRGNDKPETWTNAGMHKFEKWLDLEPGNIDQLATCLLQNIPVVVDYNWWGHSVCAMCLESVSPFKIRIWNSWGDEWSEGGEGILSGNKAIPDNAVACATSMASAE